MIKVGADHKSLYERINDMEFSMTESEFLEQAERTLHRVETELERIADSTDLDIECSRSGNVLEIEFIDNGAKIIVNSQAPMQQLWIAARSGGYHFRQENDRWIDTRNGQEFFAALSKLVSEQGPDTVTLAAD
jgi:CyaY protein